MIQFSEDYNAQTIFDQVWEAPYSWFGLFHHNETLPARVNKLDEDGKTISTKLITVEDMEDAVWKVYKDIISKRSLAIPVQAARFPELDHPINFADWVLVLDVDDVDMILQMAMFRGDSILMIYPDFLSVDVLQEDIDRSRQYTIDYEERKISGYSRAEHCPIACAIQRQFPEFTRVLVMPWHITVESADKITLAYYHLSPEMEKFMHDADMHKKKAYLYSALPADDVEPTFLETKIRSVSVKINGRFREIFQRALTDK